MKFSVDKIDKEKPYFIPLGGCGIFGANFSLYHYLGKWLIVDCGMAFADEKSPGIDILLPDPTFIEEILDDVVGMVITHGHEDHIGAIEYIWQKFPCPIYANPFALGLIKRKLSEHGWGKHVPLHEVECGGMLSLEPFHIQMINMCHSIPQMSSLAITFGETDTVLHTGDWKIDEKPVLGDVTDEKALKALGEKNILAILGDSTNAMVDGHSGSEDDVAISMKSLFEKNDTNQIIVTCFSSSVARLKSVADAAHANGRQVGLVGRSLWRIYDVAQDCGYLQDVPQFLNEEEMARLPRSKRVYLCTGSQGETRAALARIANGDHPRVSVLPNDIVIFSSRNIPGNIQMIDRVKNRLRAKDVNIITHKEAFIHVSGHPYRDELRQLIDWVKPRTFIPVHGEQMQMECHEELAHSCGVYKTLIPQNGQVIELKETGPKVIGQVKSGFFALDGKRLVPAEYEAILMRKRIMFNGCAVVTVVVDKAGKLVAEPQVTTMGLIDENSKDDINHYINETIFLVKEALRRMSLNDKKIDQHMSEVIRIAARRYLSKQFDKKPQTRVHLVRI